MSQDIIHLQHSDSSKILRSHDVTFTVDNENYQEVVTHNERIGGIDEVFQLIFRAKFLHSYHNLLLFDSKIYAFSFSCSGVLNLLNKRSLGSV